MLSTPLPAAISIPTPIIAKNIIIGRSKINHASFLCPALQMESNTNVQNATIFDMTLHTLDGVSGTLDPAFDAHIGLLRH